MRRLAVGSILVVLSCDPSGLDGYSNGVVGGGGTTGVGGSGGGGATSFAARCAAPGVLRCFGFDDAAETARFTTPSNASFVVIPTIDTEVKASGAGSLRFDAPVGATESSMAGVFAMNFTPGTDNLDKLPAVPDVGYYGVQIGEGEQFFVQWKQRIEGPLVDGTYLASPSQNLVLFSVAQGDRPDARGAPIDPLSFVLLNRYDDALMVLHQFNDPVVGDVSGTLFWQNAAGCAYGATANPACVRFVAESWMAIQLGVTVGNWDVPNSRVELWVGVDGQPVRKVIDQSDRNLPRIDAGGRFGKVHFELSDAGRSLDVPGNDPVVAARAWIDELVIGRERIPDP